MERYFTSEQYIVDRTNFINSITIGSLIKKYLYINANIILAVAVDCIVGLLPKKYMVVKAIWKYWYFYLWSVKICFDYFTLANRISLKITGQTLFEVFGIVADSFLYYEKKIIKYLYQKTKNLLL
jgi:hypothetical protein